MQRPSVPRDALVAIALAATALGLYVATLAPGLAYEAGDANELTVVVSNLGLAHPSGYPLYTWLGFLFTRLVPFGSIAHRANLMSAVLGAAGVGMTYLVGRRLRLHAVPAAFAAALFAVSTAFWSQAVITEVYAPNVFAVTATLWLALRWADGVEQAGGSPHSDRRFVVFALTYGLSLGMHLSSLSFAPAYALFALLVDPRLVRRPRTVALAVGAFLLGTAQFVWLPLRAGAHDLFPNAPPDGWARFYEYTLGAFANQRAAFALDGVPARVVAYLRLIVENFTAPGLALAVAGMCRVLWSDPKRFWLLYGMWVLHVAAFIRTFFVDADVFFVASHVLVALFVGAGVDGVRVALTRTPPRVVAALAAFLVLVPLGRASFLANDRTRDTVTEDFYDAVFDALPARSVLVPPGRGSFASVVTYWRQTRGRRPDVVVATDRDVGVVGSEQPIFLAKTMTPVGVSGRFVPRDGLYTPVLRGQRLHVLYRLEGGDAPPAVTLLPATRARVERDLGAATLIDVDVTTVRSFRPARLHVHAEWLVRDAAVIPVVTTRVDALTLEAHRLRGIVVPLPALRGATGRVVVDEFDLVLPSAMAAGSHAVALGVVELARTGVTTRWAPVGVAVIE